MMLIEEASVPDEVLPVEAFKSHLRLGTGFDESTLQDAVLRSFLRAALAAIEARTGKALIARAFSWTVTRWRSACQETLPIAPVSSIDAFELVLADGSSEPLALDRVGLEQDMQTPRIRAQGAGFPSLPRGSKTVFHITAGYGPTWDDLPADLAQAVFLLASHYYEYRDETALSRGCMPFGVQALIERYRMIRLSGGALV